MALAPPLVTAPRISYDFDIDHHVNPYIPRRSLHLLPISIAHWLGHRSAPHTPIPQPLIWLYGFLGAFISLSIVSAIYHALPNLDGHPVPIILASLGASAILEFHSISSPLSQPRNLVLGQVFSAIVGVSITKLFALLPPEKFESLRWLAGALAVGVASAVMGVTKTVHPPAGATALLAATNAEVSALGWWLVVIDILGSVVILAVALLLNNVQRIFPLWWWSELATGRLREMADLEKGRTRSDIDGNGSDENLEFGNGETKRRIVVDERGIMLLGGVELSIEEGAFLEELRTRIWKKREEEGRGEA